MDDAVMGTVLGESGAEAAAAAALDPAFFAHVCLGTHINLTPEDERSVKKHCGAAALRGLEMGFTPDQMAVLDSVRDHERTAVHSSHGTGKTFVAGCVVHWFLHSFWPSKVITTAAGGRNVEAQLWAEIRARYYTAPVSLGSEILPKAARLDIGPEHFALGFSTNDIHKFRGFHSPNILVVMDEAAGVEPDIYTAVEGLVSGGNAKILLIGNPGPEEGEFFEACRSPIYNTVHIDGLNHPNVITGRNIVPGAITRKWVEERKEEWGEDSPVYINLVRGQFTAEADKTLIPLQWVIEAEERVLDCGADTTTIGVDVARFGSNETVLAIYEGQVLEKLIAVQGRDLMDTVGRIIEASRAATKPVIAVDDDGLGGGVTDRLRERRMPVLPFRGGRKPQDEERFANLRAEAWWWMREALREGAISLTRDQVLRSQLTSVRYRFRSDGRIELERKEEMERRGVSSPDRADAAVMGWWARIRGLRELPSRRSSGRGNWRKEFRRRAGVEGINPFKG